MASDKTMTILGIDPGTNLLGYGVIAIEKVQGARSARMKPVFKDMGVLDLRKEKNPYTKLARIYEKVQWLIGQYRPDAVACESPFYGKNAQVVLKLGRAQGAAITAAAHAGIDVAEYAPREAKMAIVGNGAASKQQVNIMVQKTLDIEFDPKWLDATDALGIALCHFYHINSPLAGTTSAGSDKPGSRKKTSSWVNFIAENPSRIHK